MSEQQSWKNKRQQAAKLPPTHSPQGISWNSSSRTCSSIKPPAMQANTHFVHTATFEGSWMYGQVSFLLHFPKISEQNQNSMKGFHYPSLARFSLCITLYVIWLCYFLQCGTRRWQPHIPHCNLYSPDENQAKSDRTGITGTFGLSLSMTFKTQWECFRLSCVTQPFCLSLLLL